MPRLTDSPQNLAIFRIFVCASVLLFADVDHALALAATPAALRVAGAGAAFPLAWIPVHVDAVRAASVLLVAGCALGLVGFFTRVALAVATAAAIYVLGVEQLVGAVAHDHHMVWFLAIVAASPSADALSIDAARASTRPPAPAPAYGIPIWTARALVAAIFFFPGIWKLREAGWGWIASDNLRNQMYWKWFEHPSFTPVFRIDRYPLACRALALATVGFELTFPLALLSARLRPWAAAAAFVFHMATAAFMNIRFTSLWPCYVVLFDARRAFRGLAAEALPRKVLVRWVELVRRPTRRPPPGSTLASWVVGAVLVGGNVTAGLLGVTQAWPFACYPTFQWLAGEEVPHLAVEGLRADGSALDLTRLPQSQKEWGVQWSVLGITHGPFEAERLIEYWSLDREGQRRATDEGATRVRFYRAFSSVLPERRGEPPVRRELLYELE